MKYLPAVFVLLLGACADPVANTPRVQNDPDLHAAINGYKNCLRTYLPKYDDGKSDAKTVGEAMIGLCNPEYDFFYHNVTKGMPKVDRRALDQRRNDMQAKTAAELIATERGRTWNSALEERSKSTQPSQ